MKRHSEFCESRLVRSRWAAIGAAVAVSLGGGGLLLVDAADSPESNTVLINPVRILDTRDPADVGLAGPFVSAVSQKLQVTGTIPTNTGNQSVVPAGASGVLLNVTAVVPTAAGFISIRPGDATGTPSTSSLNFTAGSVVPNAVLVALPTSGANAGKIEITYDAFGAAGPTTEILIDVVGFTTAEALGTARVPSGKTVTGFGLWDTVSSGATDDIQISVELPALAPVALTDATVNFATNASAGDGDATCTGSIGAPTAPAGKVCIYLSSFSGLNTFRGFNAIEPAFTSRYFRIIANPTTALGTDQFFRFTWAYTAP
ncbi:MAG: hypothetical protein K8R99_00060 [Actinomycetia bacterium]|nr:hypothetical protein [Actinomycetes bacterium]